MPQHSRRGITRTPQELGLLACSPCLLPSTFPPRYITPGLLEIQLFIPSSVSIDDLSLHSQCIFSFGNLKLEIIFKDLFFNHPSCPNPHSTGTRVVFCLHRPSKISPRVLFVCLLQRVRVRLPAQQQQSSSSPYIYNDGLLCVRGWLSL